MIRKYVEYGLDSIDGNLTVEMKVKDIALIYKTIQELISFFHQRGHYKNIQDIYDYIGDKDEGMYSVLCNIRYEVFERAFEDNIKDILENDNMLFPEPKYYQE